VPTDLVSEPSLDRIVRSIVASMRPELVVLFGSRARGDARPDSDYDFLVVAGDLPGAEDRRAMLAAIWQRDHIGVELITRTAEQFERWQDDPGMLDYIAAREGAVVYSTGRVGSRTAGDRVREGPPPREGLRMWMRRAEADYREAHNSLTSPDPVWDAICFHSHAAVEKLLKALIVSRGTFPPRTHELPDLLELQPSEIRANQTLVLACKLLAELYPKSRYPDAGEPTPDEARSAIAAAAAARTVLLDWLPARE